jgi:hypothetical protein
MHRVREDIHMRMIFIAYKYIFWFAPGREKGFMCRGMEHREHIAAMLAFGILLIITVALAILYYTSSTAINIRTCFLK